jgi:hypothetical protein
MQATYDFALQCRGPDNPNIEILKITTNDLLLHRGCLKLATKHAVEQI